MKTVRCLTLVLFAASAAYGQTFDPGCPLPSRLDAIKAQHDIDDHCARDGKPSATNAKHLESAAKNNFCASGTPALVTIKSFKALQKKSDNLPGSLTNLADRAVLHDLYTNSAGEKLGEGTLVRFAGYILDAHYSNVSNGEAVNCGHAGNEWNDVHIVIGADPNESNFCNSVTAEMSPHFRPEIWTPDDLDNLKGTMVRFTGQLFFDSAHAPCRLRSNGTWKKSSPARLSVWEIHPVYSLDVCDAASCSADSENGWIPFEQFVGAVMPPG
ncbi:MAG TPA: hypothetical protein VER58_19690 [Thermoanaerobaculia bacterium]|nr:hypothetical protein [Thermoanaerobaculia bacterium]